MKAAVTLALVGVYLLTLCHSKATVGEMESYRYNGTHQKLTFMSIIVNNNNMHYR